MGDSNPVLLIIVGVFLISTPIIVTGDDVQSHSAMVIGLNCSDKCGNISIPYPFGIEEGCYYDLHNKSIYPMFKIHCNHTNNSSSPTPIFGTNIEVLNISVIEGELRSKLHVSYDYDNKYGHVKDSLSSTNLVSFTLSSTKNILVAIGCDTYAWFTGDRDRKQYQTGCMTTCTDPEDVIDGECTGVGCCQASIPGGVNDVEVETHSYYNHSHVYGFNPCNVAFPVAKDAFTF